MSHVIGVNLVISSLTALERACKELGITFMRNQQTHRWYGSWVNDYNRSDAAYKNIGIDPKNYGHCEHAIRVPGADYEIGVYKNPKGAGFVLGFDNYASGQVIAQTLGKGLEKLKQAYAVATAELQAKAAGWMTQRTKLPNGSIKLVLTGMAA